MHPAAWRATALGLATIGTLLLAGCTWVAPDEPIARQSLLPGSTIDAETVDAQNRARPGSDWGEWTAAAAQTQVEATNYLRLRNLGEVPGTAVVIDFTDAAFIGMNDTSFDIPIVGNMEMAWVEAGATSPMVPSTAPFVFMPSNGTVTVRFTENTSRIFVAYKLTRLPEVLPVQSYRASFSVTVIRPLPPPPDLTDPGFAFKDVACDGKFNLLDTPILNATIRGGIYNTNDASCLVIPPSVGKITAPEVKLESKGGGVNVRVDLESTADNLKLGGNGGFVESHKSLRAKKDLVLDSGSGPIHAQSANLTSIEGKVIVTSIATKVNTTGATIISKGEARLESGAGGLDATGASITSLEGIVKFQTGGGSLTARSITILATDDLIMNAGSGSVFLDHATLTGQNGKVEVKAGNGTLSARSVRADSAGPITFSAGAAMLDLSSVRLVSTLKDITVESNGAPVSAGAANLTARNSVTVATNGGPLNLTSGTIASSQDSVIIHTKGGPIQATAATITSRANSEVLTDGGNITTSDARITSETGTIELNARGGSLTMLRIVTTSAKATSFVASDGISMTGAKVQAHLVSVKADRATIVASNATFNATDDIRLESKGDIDLRNGRLNATVDITLDLGQTPSTVFVAAAEFRDRDNAARVRPLGVTVVGAPAFGTTS